MNINHYLLNLYKDKWDSLTGELLLLSPKKYTNPFLLSFDEGKVEKSDLRVMIFGQETKGWGDKYGFMENPEDTIQKYDRFFCQEKFYKGYSGSSFWKAFRHFRKKIINANKDKTVCFSWNNINKIGKSNSKTGISPEVRVIERKCFSVVSAEVEAFKPDIVIFLTGPNRDSDIKQHFQDAKFTVVDDAFDKRALAKVTSKSLPQNSIRLYHPSYFGGFYQVRDIAVSEVLNSI